MDWSGVYNLCIIVMYLSAVLTLIVTAPILHRESLGEQVKFSKYVAKYKLIYILEDLKVHFQQVDYLFIIYIQVHLNKLVCRGKLIYFSNSTQIVKLVY